MTQSLGLALRGEDGRDTEKPTSLMKRRALSRSKLVGWSELTIPGVQAWTNSSQWRRYRGASAQRPWKLDLGWGWGKVGGMEELGQATGLEMLKGPSGEGKDWRDRQGWGQQSRRVRAVCCGHHNSAWADSFLSPACFGGVGPIL